MIIIDVLGQPCPIPVVKAKKAIAELPAIGGSVQILVDNAAACENLGKLARGLGLKHSVDQQAEDRFAVTILVGDTPESIFPSLVILPPPNVQAAPTLVVAVGANTMGRGSEELGKILLKGFIFSLTQLDPPPKSLLFFNSGVELAAQGSNVLEDLHTLSDHGTQIWVCGTCANYFSLTEKIAVGEITNMMNIVQQMAGAQPLISL